MCQQILSISRFLPKRVKDQIPPVQIAGNIPTSSVLWWEFTGIQNCYAPDQSQFLFMCSRTDVMMLPAPMDLSWIRGEGNDTTAWQGISIPAPAWWKWEQAAFSQQSSWKENTGPPKVLAVPLNHAKLVVESFRYFSNLFNISQSQQEFVWKRQLAEVNLHGIRAGRFYPFLRKKKGGERI